MTTIDTQATLAASCVVAQDHIDGLRVLMLQRSSRSRAFPSAWVFPGGQVDDEDILVAGGGGDAALRIAAARETYEEAGIRINPESLVPISYWSPPAEAPRKFLTSLYFESATGEVHVDGSEIVDHLWISPADALSRHAAGRMEMLPPTWVTLDFFAGSTDVAAARCALELSGTSTFTSRMSADSDGPMMLWAGDEHYDDTPSGGRHRLHIGSLPWRYIKTP